MYMFGYAPVITNIKFVSIPSQQYKERAAKERTKPIDILTSQNKKLTEKTLQGQAFTSVDVIPVHSCYTKLKLPAYRQFLPSQVRRAKDDLYSPLTTDFVTLFGIRPPILRCVMQIQKYARWFVIERTQGDIDDQFDLHSSPSSNTWLTLMARVSIQKVDANNVPVAVCWRMISIEGKCVNNVPKEQLFSSNVVQYNKVLENVLVGVY